MQFALSAKGVGSGLERPAIGGRFLRKGQDLSLLLLAARCKNPTFLRKKLKKSIDKREFTRYNTMACVCGHILAPGETGGQKSKRRCNQHG